MYLFLPPPLPTTRIETGKDSLVMFSKRVVARYRSHDRMNSSSESSRARSPPPQGSKRAACSQTRSCIPSAPTPKRPFNKGAPKTRDSRVVRMEPPAPFSWTRVGRQAGQLADRLFQLPFLTWMRRARGAGGVGKGLLQPGKRVKRSSLQRSCPWCLLRSCPAFSGGVGLPFSAFLLPSPGRARR